MNNPVKDKEENKIIKMINSDLNNSEVLFDKFINKWSIDRMKKLTLNEYANPNKNSFIYDLEFKMTELGDIRHSQAFKFGIYFRKDKSNKTNERGLIYGKDYAWRSKYGNNENEAFANIKQLVNEVISNIQNNHIKAIEEIDLQDIYKWKIAFHFQNKNNISVLPIYTYEALKIYLEKHGCYEQNMTTADLHTEIIKFEMPKNIAETVNLAQNIWEEYKQFKTFNIQNEKEQIKITKMNEAKKTNATSNAEFVEYEVKSHKVKYMNLHNKLEKSFNTFLVNINAQNIKKDERYIDFQFKINNKNYICELKPTDNQTEIKYALRSAIGQILGYSYNGNYDYKVLVFQKKPRKENLEFLDYLKNYHNIYYLSEIKPEIFQGNVPLT